MVVVIDKELLRIVIQIWTHISFLSMLEAFLIENNFFAIQVPSIYTVYLLDTDLTAQLASSLLEYTFTAFTPKFKLS